MLRVCILLIVGWGLLANCTSSSTAPAVRTTIAQGTLMDCGVPMQLDIMSTPVMRSRGLMERHTLPNHYGMLFVFPVPTTPSFWMHNTPTALDIVFLSDNGTILAIESMTPNSDDRHTAPAPVRYALEVAHGYFANQSVTIGQQCTLTIPADLVIE